MLRSVAGVPVAGACSRTDHARPARRSRIGHALGGGNVVGDLVFSSRGLVEGNTFFSFAHRVGRASGMRWGAGTSLETRTFCRLEGLLKATLHMFFFFLLMGDFLHQK